MNSNRMPKQFEYGDRIRSIMLWLDERHANAILAAAESSFKSRYDVDYSDDLIATENGLMKPRKDEDETMINEKGTEPTATQAVMAKGKLFRLMDEAENASIMLDETLSVMHALGDAIDINGYMEGDEFQLHILCKREHIRNLFFVALKGFDEVNTMLNEAVRASK